MKLTAEQIHQIAESHQRQMCSVASGYIVETIEQAIIEALETESIQPLQEKDPPPERKPAVINGNYFTITTSTETAEKIRKQCEYNERCGDIRTFKLGEITIEKGLVSDYAIVQIIATKGKIDPAEIFFLGLFSAGQ